MQAEPARSALFRASRAAAAPPLQHDVTLLGENDRAGTVVQDRAHRGVSGQERPTTRGADACRIDA